MDELRTALDLWRSSRDPRLGHVLVEMSEPTGGGPQGGRGAKAQEAWLAACRQAEPEEVPDLLQTLPKAYSRQAEERLRTLWSHGPDPRVVDAAVRWARALLFRTPPNNEGWWSALRQVLREGVPADFDFEELGQQILMNHQTNFGIDTARWIGELTPAEHDTTAPTDAEEAQVAQWLERYPLPEAPSADPDRPSVEQLMEMIVADPEDDGPRAVLADVLTEQGDPRGRFIALQLKRAREGDPTGQPVDPYWAYTLPEEEKTLLGANCAEWFGPWFTAIAQTSCERGFPRDVKLSQKLRKFTKLQGEPGLATVRSAKLQRHSGGLSNRKLGKVFGDPVCANLRSIDHVYPEDLDELSKKAPQLTGLAVEKCSEALVEVGTSIDRFPGMEQLELRRLQQSDVKDLRALRVPELTLAFRRNEQVDEAETLLEQLADEVQRLVIGDWRLGSLQLVRTEDGWRVDGQGDEVLSLRLLAQIDRERFPTQVIGGYGLVVPNQELAALLADLPPAPVHVGLGRDVDKEDTSWMADLPPIPELVPERWAPEWLPAVAANTKIGAVTLGSRKNSDGVTLTRGDGGTFVRVDVSASYLSLLEPYTDDIQELVAHGWSDRNQSWEDVLAWCAERGIEARDEGRR